jgi:hypothetical protein
MQLELDQLLVEKVVKEEVKWVVLKLRRKVVLKQLLKPQPVEKLVVEKLEVEKLEVGKLVVRNLNSKKV